MKPKHMLDCSGSDYRFSGFWTIGPLYCPGSGKKVPKAHNVFSFVCWILFDQVYSTHHISLSLSLFTYNPRDPINF